ncbi:MAG: hypothetical protein ACKOFW_16890, partial [Planctomycetaceae bacterium]
MPGPVGPGWAIRSPPPPVPALPGEARFALVAGVTPLSPFPFLPLVSIVSQSLIGASKFDLDTPLLCIDLDRME